MSPQEIRRIVLERSKRANVGHIGSCLCIAEILAALYSSVLRIRQPDDPDRDRFILSKGHAALALYATLHLKGWLSQEHLETFGCNGTLLGVHPEHAVVGIDFSTGSLGHGLPIGAGAALAARLEHSARRVFVLASDAECNEGSLWEAVMFAAHHRLANLVAIIDLNGQQALGPTDQVLNMSPMADRWRSFGWDVHEVDGHDVGRLVQTFQQLDTAAGPPHAVIAQTVFGKGVSFMERQLRWHYLPMSDDQYAQAMAEVTAGIGVM
jgi:transketolase